METNTREGIEEEHPWWARLKEALLQEDKHHFCKVDATDLKFAIDHYHRHHQELQKARESERERIKNLLVKKLETAKYTTTFETANLLVNTTIEDIQTFIQSELDQPIS